MKINITKILLVLLLISVTKPFSLKKRKIKRLSLKTPKYQADHDKLSFKRIKLSGIIKSENTFEKTFSTHKQGLIIKEFICKNRDTLQKAVKEIETMDKLRECPFCLPKCGSSDPKEFEPTNPKMYLIFPSTEGNLFDFYKDEFEEFKKVYHLKDDNTLNKRIEESEKEEESCKLCSFFNFSWFGTEKPKEERKVFVPTEEHKAKFETKLYQIIQIAMAVESLHKKRVTLRNIKLQNFQYSDIGIPHKKILLSDFSLLFDKHTDYKINKNIEGNMFYLPLIDFEISNKRRKIKIDQKFDVFSLGVAFFEILVPELRERYFDRVDSALFSSRLTIDEYKFREAITETKIDLKHLRELKPVSKIQLEIEKLLFKKVLVSWTDRLESSALLKELETILTRHKFRHIWKDIEQNYFRYRVKCPVEVREVRYDNLNRHFHGEEIAYNELRKTESETRRTTFLKPPFMKKIDVLRE